MGTLHLLAIRDFWIGAGSGIVVGIVVGACWERAYELLRQAYTERTEMSDGQYATRPPRIHRRLVRALGPVGMLLLANCVVWVLIGGFQIYSYSRMGRFIQCQATYNQQSAIARDARIGVTDKEMDLLFSALRDNITAAHRLESVPADQRAALQKRLQDQLLSEFHDAVRAHEDRLRSAKDNPYPPNPVETCGNY